MRANVVDGEILPLLMEESDELAAHLDRHAPTFGHVADPGHRLEFGHASPFDKAAWTVMRFVVMILNDHAPFGDTNPKIKPTKPVVSIL